MGISVESHEICGIKDHVFTIRGGRDHHKFGDPYTFVMSAIRLFENSKTVYIFAMVSVSESDGFKISQAKELKVEFKKFGILKSIFERRKGNIHRRVEL